MKINDSTVAMSSGRSSFSQKSNTQVRSILVRPDMYEAVTKANQEEQDKPGADISISEESKLLYDKLVDAKEAEKKASQQKSAKNWLERQKKAGKITVPEIHLESKDEQMLQTLRRLLEMLARLRKKGGSGIAELAVGKSSQYTVSSMHSWSADGTMVSRSDAFQASLSQSVSVAAGVSSGQAVDLRSSSVSASGGGVSWIRHTEERGHLEERETTVFSAQGVAHTADGRDVVFNVDLGMSRRFSGEYLKLQDEKVIFTDPLVINLENSSAEVTDQKFYFDLDSDGEAEELSGLAQGSGFLAYDRNDDGVINDGSELFGTKSGDGFKDLAAYDQDGNGWIDENDDIFTRLKVWTKDEKGNDRLIDLKEADVGAIFLGNAETQFHLNDAATNQTNARIQSTGIFLKESGGAGTVQHVDFAV